VANELALKTVADGGSVLDAVEQAIRLVEADERNSSVGIGGIPNAEGVVQLDACIMDGPVHGAGSVAALEGILHPISVARRVMEQTSHVMLVGEGARQFALQQGFPSTHLLTEERRKDWLAWKRTEAAKREPAPASHDTIALVGVDDQGNMAGGCSTSGWGYKLPGRVGDSPIIGSGLYVDNQIGAAGATGVGENVMRYCGSFMVVEAMRAGMDPTEACVSVIRRIAEKDPKDYADLHINFIALSRDGRYGAAGTDQGFDFAVADRLTSQVFSGTRVEP
jgi:L-asparaginase/N4-(beta-N-acetylglucosaminyl)-L-asparaginase